MMRAHFIDDPSSSPLASAPGPSTHVNMYQDGALPQSFYLEDESFLLGSEMRSCRNVTSPNDLQI